MTAPSARSLGIATRRERIAMEGGMRCYYCRCGLTMAMGQHNSATIDHKRPKCRGGTNARGNLVAACHGRNNLKGGLTASEFRQLHPVVTRRTRQRERERVRKAIMAGGGRWRPDDRAGYRASDMGLDSPPMIGLAAVWPGQDGRVG